MKPIGAFIAMTYLAPPVGVLAYGLHSGAIDGFGALLVAVLRILVCAIAGFAFANGVGESKYFKDKSDTKVYFYIFPIYVLMFFVFGLFLGIDMQSPDTHQVGRYTY